MFERREIIVLFKPLIVKLHGDVRIADIPGTDRRKQQPTKHRKLQFLVSIYVDLISQVMNCARENISTPSIRDESRFVHGERRIMFLPVQRDQLTPQAVRHCRRVVRWRDPCPAWIDSRQSIGVISTDHVRKAFFISFAHALFVEGDAGRKIMSSSYTSIKAHSMGCELLAQRDLFIYSEELITFTQCMTICDQLIKLKNLYNESFILSLTVCKYHTVNSSEEWCAPSMIRLIKIPNSHCECDCGYTYRTDL